MKAWKAGALTGALVVAAGAGASISPVAHGQSRDREPMARAVQLLGGGAQIGVVVHDADSKDPAGGVVIDDVRSGSAADKAGFKDGDAVVEFDGERVRSVAQFQRLVRETPEDRSVQAVVVRDKQRVTLSVTPDRARGFDYSNDFPMLLRATPAPPAPPAVPRAARPYLTPTMPGFEAFTLRSSDVRLGIVTETLSDQLYDYFGVKSGVLVRSVENDSPAAKAGVKAGDVITAVNGHHIDDPSDIRDELRGARDDDFTLDVTRDRKAQTVKGKLDERETRPRRRTGAEL